MEQNASDGFVSNVYWLVDADPLVIPADETHSGQCGCWAQKWTDFFTESVTIAANGDEDKCQRLGPLFSKHFENVCMFPEEKHHISSLFYEQHQLIVTVTS